MCSGLIFELSWKALALRRTVGQHCVAACDCQRLLRPLDGRNSSKASQMPGQFQLCRQLLQPHRGHQTRFRLQLWLLPVLFSAGKARMLSCQGRFAPAWLLVAPTTDALTFSCVEFQVAMRRRLGLAIAFEGPDSHGHGCLTTNIDGRLNSRHAAWLTGWRQVLVEAGGQVPDRNVERTLV